MSEKEKQNENLIHRPSPYPSPKGSGDELEAELAALVPRHDQLDPRWRAFLAKAADLNADAIPAHAACCPPSDHLFLCAYCGASRPRISRIRRWAWPAACSAVTAAATVFLTLLVLKPDSPSSHHVASLPVTETKAPAPPVPSRHQVVSDPPYNWALNSGRWRQERLCRLVADDPQLFDLALREYFHQPPPENVVVAANHFQKESIPTAQQLLNEMLKQTN